jgi:hypothetical protein
VTMFLSVYVVSVLMLRPRVWENRVSFKLEQGAQAPRGVAHLSSSRGLTLLDFTTPRPGT